MRAIAITLIFAGLLLAGSKHDFPRAVLVYSRHPDPPIERFAAGSLGIPGSAYARIYLYAIYRYLTDRPFSAAEQRAYMSTWRVRAQPAGSWPKVDTANWIHTRARYAPRLALGALSRVEPVATRNYAYVELCGQDAFDTAARTLEQRVKQFGEKSTEVRFWLVGQDAVFQTCNSEDPNIPPQAPQHMPALIQADREYQIAAALFYAQRFDEAADAFRRVAANRTSPWRLMAPYLVGRSLLWQARQMMDQKAYLPSLRKAETQFRAVLANPTLKSTHDAADLLYMRCRMITNPADAGERMARRLLSTKTGVKERDLFMYLTLLDSMESDSRDKKVVWPKDDLTAYLRTFEPDRAPAALERWRQTRSNAWLLAAITLAQTYERDLVEASIAAPLTTPGGTALHFHAARLLAISGDFDRARSELEGVLVALKDQPSSRNRVLELSAQLARTTDEFFRRAPLPVLLVASEIWDSELKGVPEYKNFGRLPRLSIENAEIINRRLPLSVMESGSKYFPPHLQEELQLVTWTRAVLLGRWSVASSLAPYLIPRYPKAATRLRAFVAAPNETTAAYALLDLPGARPYISEGLGRGLPFDKGDEWGRNWWYAFNRDEMYTYDQSVSIPDPPSNVGIPLLPRLPMLTPDEERVAAEEWKQLGAHIDGLNWIAIRIVADIERNPKRTDAAAVLYRVVEQEVVMPWAYPPNSKRSASGVTRAWQLLKTRYRTSPWALKLEDLSVPFGHSMR